jgi:2-(3-amino-3-carboxypropyl)histidine synthase
MYVFVEISIEVEHIVKTISTNVSPNEKIYLMSTIQFNSCLCTVKKMLLALQYSDVTTPQCKPRSAGEVLGCTSPFIPEKGLCIFIGDGRFHIESAMINNPHLNFFQYNPYTLVNIIAEIH